MKARILWVEGKRAESPPFVPALRKKGYTVETAATGNEALALLPGFDPDLVVVNAASMRTSGKRVCRVVRKKAKDLPILLISDQGKTAFDASFADTVLSTPLSSDQLMDSMKEFEPGANILWIQKTGKKSPHLAELMKSGYLVTAVSKSKEALDYLQQFSPDIVIIYGASQYNSGKQIGNIIRKKSESVRITVIYNSTKPIPEDTNANYVLRLPFTTRKLLNRIKPFLPGEGQNTLHTGPIRLDLERKRVLCLGREATLTPRLCQLLKSFMEHPGEALERGQLFREVWSTEYTGDTRTLDVHISWLRQAIEQDPRKPHFLKTIRGVGYRLDA